MTTPPPPPPPPERPESKAAGVVLGVLTTLAAGVAALLAAAIDTRLWVLGFLLVLVGGLVLGRNRPGFAQGIAWSFGVALIVFTACTLVVINSLG